MTFDPEVTTRWRSLRGDTLYTIREVCMYCMHRHNTKHMQRYDRIRARHTSSH